MCIIGYILLPVVIDLLSRAIDLFIVKCHRYIVKGHRSVRFFWFGSCICFQGLICLSVCILMSGVIDLLLRVMSGVIDLLSGAIFLYYSAHSVVRRYMPLARL